MFYCIIIVFFYNTIITLKFYNYHQAVDEGPADEEGKNESSK